MYVQISEVRHVLNALQYHRYVKRFLVFSRTELSTMPQGNTYKSIEATLGEIS